MSQDSSTGRALKKPRLSTPSDAAAAAPVPLLLATAPMVNQSELAFRMLVHSLTETGPVDVWRQEAVEAESALPVVLPAFLRPGTVVSYTPMLWADRFVAESEYRQTCFRTVDAESVAAGRPLVAQFAGSDPAILVQAVNRLNREFPSVAMADLNLGCPQPVAKRLRFGAHFAVESRGEPAIACVREMAANAPAGFPVSCKLRVLESASQNRAMARALQTTGCSLVAVHGRTLAQNRANNARFELIRSFCSGLTTMPVLSNGSVSTSHDLDKALTDTGAHGVMSAEPLLVRPSLFRDWLFHRFPDGEPPNIDQFSQVSVATAYLELAKQHHSTPKQAREHVLHMLGLRRRSYAAFQRLGMENQFMRYNKAKRWRASVIQAETVDDLVDRLDVMKSLLEHNEIDIPFL